MKSNKILLKGILASSEGVRKNNINAVDISRINSMKTRNIDFTYVT
ncbi:MAG: hypothetical protein RR409_12800 [Clostridium sp.]